MNLANVLRHRVQIQLKVTTQGPTGDTVIWKFVRNRYARVISLDAEARAVYMQMKSEVTHKVVFRGTVDISLGNNRMLWKAKTLAPVGPPQELDNSTVVMVKEV